MHNTSLRLLVLVVGCAVSAHATANAGTTSAGVIPTTGTSTDPSPNVEQQSSGFVQQNQQLQNATSPNGIALPAGVVAGTKPGQSASADAAANDPAHAADANGHAAAAAATPAAPPAPPPTYVSVIKHLNGSSDAADPPTPESKAPVVAPESAPAHAPPQVAPMQKPARPVAQNPKPAAEAVVAPPASTGGRGNTPDGITFYAGLAIAGLLLAFAFRLFLHTGKNDANRG